ncbi:MAG: hypothetical protein K9H16_12845 [Bacteroidales bacterium]|nr:hypothetical protein [Bacteroidales bacterium]
MHLNNVVLVLLVLWASVTFSQINESSQVNDSDDLEAFYAETKQVNQFMRRFNAEEDPYGTKLSTANTFYHDSKLRKQYITLLFDQENQEISGLLKSAFINDVTLPDRPKFLNFHGGDWFGETVVKFRRGSKEVYITLLMKLVKENLGSKWVIDDVRYNPYEDLYAPDSQTSDRFLHPLSHELDFMNLDKVFRTKEHTGDYFKQGFKPCKLSVFLYELKNGYLEFEYVSDVKFHFFQLDGWYFEITEFNRPGLNRGWLISNLIKLENGQKESLINYLYNLD